MSLDLICINIYAVSRYGNADFGQKNHPSVLSRTLSASKFCRGDALASQIDSGALKPVGRRSVDRYPSKVANLSEVLGQFVIQVVSFLSFDVSRIGCFMYNWWGVC